MRRGTFDIKHFSIYDEDGVFTFVIQMRNYIMREWPDTRKSEEQGFVANLWDIYVDADGRINSGYSEALPGRDLEFSDNMGWEKVILVSPLSEYSVFEALRNKTDELDFQNRIEDIIYPDYVYIQRDKIIVKISKKKLPGVTANSGFQCFAMGFYNIVSPNRLLNRDVKAFPTAKDFGGGHDTYGDPPIMDMIVPEGEDQYELLRKFKSQPYRENITYASVPFVYKDGKRQSPVTMKRPVANPMEFPGPAVTPAKLPAPIIRSGNTPAGFVPLEPVTPDSDLPGFKPMPKLPAGFMPVKKN
jgi:hypothetical protein